MTNLSTVSPDNQPPSEQDQITPPLKNGHEQEHVSAQVERSANAEIPAASSVRHHDLSKPGLNQFTVGHRSNCLKSGITENCCFS